MFRRTELFFTLLCIAALLATGCTGETSEKNGVSSDSSFKNSTNAENSLNKFTLGDIVWADDIDSGPGILILDYTPSTDMYTGVAAKEVGEGWIIVKTSNGCNPKIMEPRSVIEADSHVKIAYMDPESIQSYCRS